MKRQKKPTAARFLAKSSLLLFLVLLVGWGSYRYAFAPPLSAPGTVTFTIPEGSSVLAIGRLLADVKLLRSPRLFQLYVRLTGLSLQAGDYTLSPASLPTLAHSLTAGRDAEITLTIPEGYRREQIAELVSLKLGLSASEFLTASASFEGYLFPDTYAFTKDDTVSSVISTLRANFDKKTINLALTPQDVILGSIVEREALSAAEKPIIAGILTKRLAEGWPLEVDATIQYIMGKSGDWWPTPLLGDRARPSTYNTYLHPGLPPAPIGNPGLISLQAAKNPESTPYYFYLHDKSGMIHYAATNKEHEANIRKYIY